MKNNFLHDTYEYLKFLFDIKHDKDEEGAINNIKKAIEFRGENLWALVCAIFIASIGLNTNSTAVIIGAMLISPLMGPIVGTGLAIGINDIELLKYSLKNLLISVIVSILTSTLYFSISPLTEVQSELLARTYPTIFDVFIALFGGIAGIVANTRKEKSNVIPGVAIATALMPPLCTAGYGLASGNYYFFLGAFYLFFINSVFICIATVLIIQYLGFEKKHYLEPLKEKRIRFYVFVIALITIIPSTYTAWNIINESLYKSKVIKYINEAVNFKETKLINQKITYNGLSKSFLELTFIGAPISEKEALELKNKASDYKITNTEITINQTKNNTSKLEEQLTKLSQTSSNLKYEILEEFYNKNIQEINNKNKQIEQLNKTVSEYKKQIENIKSHEKNIDISKILKEVRVYYPQISDMTYTESEKSVSGKLKVRPIVIAKWSKTPLQIEKDKVLQFLRVRTQKGDLELINL